MVVVPPLAAGVAVTSGVKDFRSHDVERSALSEEEESGPFREMADDEEDTGMLDKEGGDSMTYPADEPDEDIPREESLRSRSRLELESRPCRSLDDTEELPCDMTDDAFRRLPPDPGCCPGNKASRL
jgi:hypothetical protein